jgi:hypothetical protein
MGHLETNCELYNKHFNVVKSDVATFHAESAVAVRESQTAFSEPEIACSMAYVRSNFGWIPDSINKLETTGISLQESMCFLENAEVKLSAVRGETGEKDYIKFQAVLKKESRLFHFYGSTRNPRQRRY